MAGSYEHLIGLDGNFTFDRIDNLGDAREACEDCFNRIARLLRELDETYGMTITPETSNQLAKVRAENNQIREAVRELLLKDWNKISIDDLTELSRHIPNGWQA